jgi:hypothetical protein
MRVSPAVRVQTLAECKSGQLVRNLGQYGDGRLGVVFDAGDWNEALRGIVYLGEDAPAFEVANEPEQTSVLVYSGNVVFVVDQNGPNEMFARSLYEQPGVVICSKDGLFLNVSSAQGFGSSVVRMQLDLSTGKLYQYKERLRKVAFFGAWSISLEEAGNSHDCHHKMLDFSVSSKPS